MAMRYFAAGHCTASQVVALAYPGYKLCHIAGMLSGQGSQSWANVVFPAVAICNGHHTICCAAQGKQRSSACC